MVGSRLTVHLFRDSFNTPWGFRLQGGKDLTQPLTVQRVFSNSPAEGELQRGDIILSISSRDAADLTHKQAQDLIKHGGGQVQLVVNRPPPGSHIGPLSPPIVTQKPRAPSLQSLTSPLSPNLPPFSPTRQPTTPIRSSLTPTRPITFTSSITNDVNYHKRSHKPSYRPLNIQAAQDLQNHNFQRQSSSLSQPHSTPTPTTPIPPWAAQQFSPKKVLQLSKLGGKGQDFGSDYATYSRKSSTVQFGVPSPPIIHEGQEEPPPDRLATGPIPKVCHLRNLGGGGGGQNLASGFESSTFPRRNHGHRTSVQPASGSSAPGYGYQNKNYGQAPGQRIEYPHSKSGMLNRVQNSLDNITLSPRTPEVHVTSPFFQPYQQMYTPTGLLLEQQRLQEQQAESENVAPVWERRKQFQEAPVQRSTVRAPGKKKKAPRVVKPQPGATSCGTFGIDYSHPSSKQPSGGWRKAPEFKPTPAPVPASSIVTYTPIAIHYTPKPGPPPTAPKPSPLSPSYAPVQSTPPAWKRQEEVEDNTGTPAWRSTLKSSGIKPWEMETNYAMEQQPVRSVPYNPTPAKSPVSPGPFSPPGAPRTGGSENGPKVMHLQYNSPLHLYSNQNVAETLKGQTQSLSGQTKPAAPTTNEAGERDWSQSAVLRYINQEDTRKSKHPAPAVAPKPQYSPVKAPHGYQPFQQEIGSSEY